MNYKHLIGTLFVCMFILAAGPLFGQVATNIDELEWRDIDTFAEGDAGWTIEGSPFIGKDFIDEDKQPKDRLITTKQPVDDTRPITLDLERPSQDRTVLGVRAGFERRGHNAIDFVPDGGGCVLDGVVHDIEVWAWGMLRDYELEVELREVSGPRAGISYIVPLGSIAHRGWQKLTVRVSDFIPPQRSQFAIGANLALISLRLRTLPNESVDEFFLYLDDFRYRTSTSPGDVFDGQDLFDRVGEIWDLSGETQLSVCGAGL